MDSKFVESKHKLALKKTLFNVLTTKKFRHVQGHIQSKILIRS